jgi:hypothetical protein
MSRHQKKGGLPRYVALFHWMLNSEAWKDLRPAARAIYTEINKRYNGSNNGFITYSVREAQRDVHVSKSTAARAFDELASHGFIVAEQRGAFHWKINPNGSKIRPASEWRLTVYDNNRTSNVADMAASKDFMRWQKIQNAVPPEGRMVPVVRPHGPRHGTIKPKRRSNGTSHGTIKGVTAA